MDSITLELLFFAIVIYEEPWVFHIFCRYVFNQWKTLKTAISFFRRLWKELFRVNKFRFGTDTCLPPQEACGPPVPFETERCIRQYIRFFGIPNNSSCSLDGAIVADGKNNHKNTSLYSSRQ